MSKVVLLSTLGVIGNFVALACIGALNTAYYSGQDIVNTHEEIFVTKKLFNIDFEKLENKQFRTDLEQHRDEHANSIGFYNHLLFVVKMLTTTFVSIGIAVYTMRDFWPLLLTDGGETFFETKWMCGILLSLISIVWIFVFLVSGRINKKNAILRKEYGEVSRIFGYYSDIVSDYKTGKEIRIFKEENFIENHATHQLLNKGLNLQKKIATNQAILNSIGTLIFSVVVFCVYLIVAVKARAGLYSLGDMVIYIGGFLRIIYSLQGIAMLIGRFKSIMPQAELYYNILDTPERVMMGTLLPQKIRHNIECKNLYFRYNESSEYVLKNINLSINDGDKIAIVGENGSGKTTLIKLICGFYKPSKGAILLDGKQVSEYCISSYSELFSVVFQDSKVFSLPLDQNIAANCIFDEEEVRLCLNKIGYNIESDINKFIYRDCDDNGVEISGGEAQKILIARALYKNAPIFVFDEPTSALDPIVESEIYKRINLIVNNKTTIFISHRLSSCQFCDKIVVLDNGCLVQWGSHKELINDKDGQYYKLWNAQAKYYV